MDNPRYTNGTDIINLVYSKGVVVFGEGVEELISGVGEIENVRVIDLAIMTPDEIIQILSLENSIKYRIFPEQYDEKGAQEFSEQLMTGRSQTSQIKSNFYIFTGVEDLLEKNMEDDIIEKYIRICIGLRVSNNPPVLCLKSRDSITKLTANNKLIRANNGIPEGMPLMEQLKAHFSRTFHL